MNTYVSRNGKIKPVKNLGWLLRNWQDVKALGFNYWDKSSNPQCNYNHQLVARLKDGGVYITDFADFGVAFNWVNRPVFKGLEFRVRKFTSPNDGDFYSFIIGDEKYKKINKTNNSGFLNEFYQLVFCPENLSKEQRGI